MKLQLGLIITFLLLAIVVVVIIIVNRNSQFDEPAIYNSPTTTNGNALLDPSELAFPEYDYGGWWWDYPWMWTSYPIYDYGYYPYIWGDRYYRHGDRHWNHPRGDHPRPPRPPIGGGAPRSGGRR